MNLGVKPFETGQCGVDGMAEFFFLGIEIANGVALLDGASCGDGAGRGEQCLGKCGLACCAVAD